MPIDMNKLLSMQQNQKPQQANKSNGFDFNRLLSMQPEKGTVRNFDASKNIIEPVSKQPDMPVVKGEDYIYQPKTSIGQKLVDAGKWAQTAIENAGLKATQTAVETPIKAFGGISDIGVEHNKTRLLKIYELAGQKPPKSLANQPENQGAQLANRITKTLSQQVGGFEPLNKYGEINTDLDYGQKLAGKLGSAGGSMLAFMGASLLTGGSATAPALISGLQQAGLKYTQVKEAGKTPEEARNISLKSGVTEGLLEGLGFNFLLKKYGGTLSNIAIRSFTEGTQEALQTAGEQAIDISSGLRKNPKINDLAQEQFESFLIGFGMGLPASVIITKAEREGLIPELQKIGFTNPQAKNIVNKMMVEARNSSDNLIKTEIEKIDTGKTEPLAKDLTQIEPPAVTPEEQALSDEIIRLSRFYKTLKKKDKFDNKTTVAVKIMEKQAQLNKMKRDKIPVEPVSKEQVLSNEIIRLSQLYKSKESNDPFNTKNNLAIKIMEKQTELNKLRKGEIPVEPVSKEQALSDEIKTEPPQQAEPAPTQPQPNIQEFRAPSETKEPWEMTRFEYLTRMQKINRDNGWIYYEGDSPWGYTKGYEIPNITQVDDENVTFGTNKDLYKGKLYPEFKDLTPRKEDKTKILTQNIPSILNQLEPENKDYLYHYTKINALDKIKKEGLKAKKSLNKQRSELRSTHPHIALKDYYKYVYGFKDADPDLAESVWREFGDYDPYEIVLLRFKKGDFDWLPDPEYLTDEKGNFIPDIKKEDIFAFRAKGSIPSSDIEIKIDDKWVNISNYKGFESLPEHKAEVFEALKRGKSVPKDVLAEYPDLAKKFKTEPPQQAEPAPVSSEDAQIEAKTNQPLPKNGLASSGGNKIGEFEQINLPNKQPEDFKLFNESAKLLEKYQTGIWGETKLPRKYNGLFYNDSGNIFIKALNDVATVVHEIVHSIDQKYDYVNQFMKVSKLSSAGNPVYDSATKDIRKKLSDVYLSYYPTSSSSHPLQTRIKEGLATFIQKYIEQPSLMEQQYPDLVNDIINPSGKYHNKIIADLIKDTRENIIIPYQQLDELDKIGSRITNTDKPDVEPHVYLSKWDRVIQEATDAVYPLEKISKEADSDMYLYTYFYQNGLKTVVSNNIFSNKGYTVYSDGNFTKKHDFNFKTIVKSLKQKGLVDRFDSWLVARRNHFLYKKLDELEIEIKDNKENYNKNELALLTEQFNDIQSILNNDGFTRAEIDKGYLDNKNDFIEEAKMFDTLNQEHLNLLRQSNLITDEQYNNFSQTEGYASFKRQVYDEMLGFNEKQQSQIKVGGTKISSLKKRTGGMQTIISPLYSSIKAENEIYRKAMKQIIYNKLIPISGQLTDLFEMPELVISVDGSGKVTYPQEYDQNIIMARDGNGKRVPIKVLSEIKTVIDECLNPVNMHVLERMLTVFSKTFTLGTTQIFLPFTIANVIIDQITATSQTFNNYTPIYTTLKLISKQLFNSEEKPSEYLKEYLSLGGERQTFAGWQDAEPKKLMQIINNEQSGMEKISSLLETGVSILGIPSQVSEIFTRSQEYILARLNGKSQLQAMEDAGRVTAPFHHIGRLGGKTVGKSWVKSISFFNASLQVLAQSAKSTNTKRFWFVTSALTTALIGSLQYFLKKASDEQKRKLKNIDANLMSKYMWFPHPNGKDLIHLRIPENQAIIGQMINMATLEYLGKSNYNASEYIDVATGFLPDQINPYTATMEPVRFLFSWLPQMTKPAIEAGVNKKIFPRVTDLVPKSLQNEIPEKQFTKYTPEYAKWLGDKFEVSPITINHLVKGYLGRATNPAQQITNPVIHQAQFYSYRQIQDLYDMDKFIDSEIKSIAENETNVSDNYKSFLSEIGYKTNYVKKVISHYKKAVQANEPKETLVSLENNILDIIDTLPTYEEVKQKIENKGNFNE